MIRNEFVVQTRFLFSLVKHTYLKLKREKIEKSRTSSKILSIEKDFWRYFYMLSLSSPV